MLKLRKIEARRDGEATCGEFEEEKNQKFSIYTYISNV